LDIKDLYVNIPISETIYITKSHLLKISDIQTTNQIITLLEIILNQNYFSFHGQIYQPDKGMAMGSPISGTMAEIFLQHLENTHVKHLIESNILSYTRYVDDILVIYDSTLTTPDNIQLYLSTNNNNGYSALGPVWQKPEPSQVTGMALVRCILGKFLGVVCRCFPPAISS
jgi:hypothetical protein